MARVYKARTFASYRLKVLRYAASLTGPQCFWQFAVHANEKSKRQRAVAWLLEAGHLKHVAGPYTKNGYRIKSLQITVLGRFSVETGVL